MSNKGAKVVLLAHQSRPGKKDFTDLSQHANALSDLLNLRVKYIDSIFSKAAKEAIKQLKPHEILLLENVRFFSEESLSRPAEAQAETLLVRQLPATQISTTSGILLPNTEEHRGVVVCVGENVTAYKPGDIVVINLAHGNIFQHYICGQLLAPMYQSTLLGKYSNHSLPVVDGTGV